MAAGVTAHGWTLQDGLLFRVPPWPQPQVVSQTVLGWLVEAAEQLKAFSTYFLHDLHLNQVQLDELYAVLSAVRDGDMSAAEAIERLSRSPHWVWTAIDPETKVLLSAQVGARTLAMAQAVLHHIAQ